MRVVYNGIDINVLETYEFVGDPVYDESQTDYLYTRYSILVRGIINGQVDVLRGTVSPVDGVRYQNGPVMSYRMDGNSLVVPASNNLPAGGFVNFSGGFNNAVPPGGTVGDRPNPYVPFGTGFQGGFTGPINAASEPGTGAPITNRLFSVVPAAVTTNLTHAAIRYRLTTPRGQLFIFAGPIVGGVVAPVEMMVASPRSGDIVDANNGPKPKLLAVTQAFGDANTLLVDFAVETYVNEAEDNGTALSAGATTNPAGLLSNRFSQVHTVDKNGYSSVATAGTVVFRTDLLYRNQLNPDSIRDRLFMPIPVGFVREEIKVRGRSDVTGVDYEYVDVQQPVNFPAGIYVKAASISAVHRQAVMSGSVLEGALSTYERVLGIAANRSIAKGDSDKKAVPTESSKKKKRMSSAITKTT